MRENIKTELSEKFCSAILMPIILHDYEYAMEDMIQLNIAYAVMLVEQGMLDRESAVTIIDGLKYVQNNAKPEDFKGQLEDFYFNVERLMFKKVGSDIGGRLHVGRSRNDIDAVLNRMEIREAVWDILELLLELQTLLLAKAAENTETVITGYTHGQPAQPITLGHYYMAFYNALARDYKRILSAYETANVSPYGAAACAGSSFPISRQMLCDFLGFDSILENSFDCIAARDYYAELISAFALMSVNVSQICEDMYFWASYENGMLEVSGDVAICSSIMPQKFNPISFEMARAKAAHLIGQQTAVMSVLKGNHYTNNMDIYEIPLMFSNAVDQVKQMLICMIESITYSKVRKERALKQATDNLCTVTSLADYLVKNTGISFTNAHDIVSSMVAAVIGEGTFIRGMTADLLKVESVKKLGYEIVLTQAEIDGVLEPFNNVQTKTGIGGTSVASVNNMIAKGQEILAAENFSLKQLKDHVREAYLELDRKVAALSK